jgi:DegV family protein with EDD domain
LPEEVFVLPRVKIVTDSTSDIPDALAWEMQIAMVPLNVRFGEETFKDRVDMDSRAFFTQLARSRVLPTTSMPSPEDFKRLYQDLAGTCDTIISVHLSSKLSGTYQAAANSCREASGGVRVVPFDSGQVSAGLFLVAQRAAQAAATGADEETIMAQLRADCAKVRMYFVLDTLEYLQRGGRIGLAGQMLGGMLNVKPILTVKNGAIESAARARSRLKAFQRVIELLTEGLGRPSQAVVGHAVVPDEARRMESMLRGKFGDIKIHTCEIGPVIGTHSGPGCVEVAAI